MLTLCYVLERLMCKIPDEMLSERFLILMNKQIYKSGASTIREKVYTCYT